MRSITWQSICEWGVAILVGFSILWRGGKGLEATWLLAGTAGLVAMTMLFVFSVRKRNRSHLSPLHSGFIVRKPVVPVFLRTTGILFVCWTILSFIFSETRNYGLDEVLRDTSLVLIFFWAVRTVAEEEKQRLAHLITQTIAGCAVVASAIGIGVYALQPVNRFVGTFFDHRFHTDYWPNAWAEFLLLAWPLLLALAIKERHKISGWVMFAMTGMLWGALALSYSRGGMIVLGGQVVMLLLFTITLQVMDVRYNVRLSREMRQVFLQTCLALAVTSSVFFGINALRGQRFEVQSVLEKVTFTASEGTSSIDERGAFWSQAWELSLEEPLVGYGPYSFRFVQPPKMTHVLATSDHPHNVFLKLAVERGWAASILFFLLVAYVVLAAIKRLFTMRRTEWSQEKDVRVMMTIAAVSGVLVHNLIDYNLQFVGIALPLWLCLAFLVAPAQNGAQGDPSSFHRWKLERVLTKIEIALACALVVVAVLEARTLILSSFGRHAHAAGNLDEALGWYEKSTSEILSRDLFLSMAELHLAQNEIAEADNDVEHYLSLNPHDPRAWKMKGIVAAKDDMESAYTPLDTAYQRGRYSDLSLLRHLLEAGEHGHRENLLPRKEEFDALFSAYAGAIENNTHFIALSNNPEELMTVARLLGRLYPLDDTRYLQIARRAMMNAREEREKLSARPTGQLW